MIMFFIKFIKTVSINKKYVIQERVVSSNQKVYFIKNKLNLKKIESGKLKTYYNY